MRTLLHSVGDMKIYRHNGRAMIEMWRAGRFVTSFSYSEYENIWKKLFKQFEKKSQQKLDF